MNEHIKHLEEPLYYGDFTNTNLNFLDMVYSPKFSIKIDGSPSIFFGCVDDKFFIATKSIFNKNRKMFFSIDEIYQNTQDEELAEKLKTCFLSIEGDFKNNLIYQADLISWNKNENNIYQPNVLKYKLNTDSIVNFSIHTTYYDLNFVERQYFDDVKHESNHNNTVEVDQELFTKMLLKYQEWQEYKNEIISFFNTDMIQQIQFLSTKSLPLERYFNNCIRTNITPSAKTFSEWFEEKHQNFFEVKGTPEYKKFLETSKNIYNADWFHNYIDFYNFTVICKNSLIKVIDDYVSEYNTTHINHVANFEIMNVNNCHEGYVFSTPCRKIKMVNRSEFSYHNFLSHGMKK